LAWRAIRYLSEHAFRTMSSQRLLDVLGPEVDKESLEAWGNLRSDPDTSRVTTVDDW